MAYTSSTNCKLECSRLMSPATFWNCLRVRALVRLAVDPGSAHDPLQSLRDIWTDEWIQVSLIHGLPKSNPFTGRMYIMISAMPKHALRRSPAYLIPSLPTEIEFQAQALSCDRMRMSAPQYDRVELTSSKKGRRGCRAKSKRRRKFPWQDLHRHPIVGDMTLWPLFVLVSWQLINSDSK